MRNPKRSSDLKYKIFVFLIISAGLFLRLWNFNKLFYFAIDEEKAAYIIKGIIDFTHFPTVGYPSSVGFRLGPLLYYLAAPFYKIFGPYPYVLGYTSVTASVISMIIIYKMSKFIGRIAMILALALYSFSYLNILYDRRGWAVSFHSLIALTILYCLLNLRRKKSAFTIPLTFALIAATHFEVATILFLPLILICFYIFKITIPKKLGIFCISLFLLSHLSLLVFDFRHNFLNTKYFLNYFRKDAVERIAPNVPLVGIRSAYLAHNLIPNTFARTLLPSIETNAAIQYANCPQYLSYKQSRIPFYLKLTVIVIFAIFFARTIKNWRKQADEISVQKVILLYFLLLFAATTLYTYAFQGEMAEYYMLSGFAYFFVLLGILLGKMPHRFTFLVVPLIFLFASYNSYQILTSFNPYGWTDKLEAVSYALNQVEDKPFVLSSFTDCWSTGGYRYLFTLKGKEPQQSYMDENLSEYYSPDLKSIPVDQITILTPELLGPNPPGFDEYRQKILSGPFKYNKFGAIEVYITPKTAELSKPL